VTLQLFDSVLSGLQKTDPRVYDALRLLGNEVTQLLNNNAIKTLISDGTNKSLYALIGVKRDSEKRSIVLNDILDSVNFGGTTDPFGKFQAEENTNDHLPYAALVAKRARQDTTAPNAGFGVDTSFLLAGALVHSEPEAGRVRVEWEQNQTDNTTARDSTISLWNMLNAVIQKVMTINSAGTVAFPVSLGTANRIVFTGSGGALTISGSLQFDPAVGTVTIIGNSSAVTDPQIDASQSSSGDAFIRLSLSGSTSFALGIDNSDADNFKLSRNTAGNASLGTNDILTIDTSDRGGFGVTTNSSFKFRINKTSENTVLQLIHSDALTSPSEEIRQDSTGDASIRWQLGTGDSFIAGIDNSDGNFFKISYGSAGNAALGTNDRIAIDLSGRIVVQGSTFTSGRLVQLNHFEEGSWLWLSSSFINPAITLENNGSGGRTWQIISPRTGGTFAAGAFVVRDNTGAANRLGIDLNGNFVIGPLSALGTTATDGFLYIPSCAGTPTGVPTAFTGKIPLVYDSTNNILYAYSGGSWRTH